MQNKQLNNQFSQRNLASYKPKTFSTTKLKIKIIANNLPLNFFKPYRIKSENHSFEAEQNVQIVTPSFGSKDLDRKVNQSQEKIEEKWFVKKKNALTHRAQTESLQYKQMFSRQLYTKKQRRSTQNHRRQGSKNISKKERKTLIPKKMSQNSSNRKKGNKYQELQKRLTNKYSWQKIKPQKKLNFLANFAFQNRTEQKEILKNFSKNVKSFRPKKLLPPINIDY